MPEPAIPQTAPYVIDCEPGTYAWCACGRSARQPYCDGSHKGTGMTPVIENVVATRKVAWCGCKHSQKRPFCDGSHTKLRPPA
ncbi:MAG: CDGSH iron-sulfur domain-containing protein [Planctomycetes bacterium]|nr:CDGSH iron-sulfur domain-containing protein [Planctomycetota bacterium]